MKTEGQFCREIKKNSGEKYFSSFPLATRVCEEEYDEGIYGIREATDDERVYGKRNGSFGKNMMEESMDFFKQMTEKVTRKTF